MHKKVKWFIVGGVLCLVAAVVFKLGIKQLEMIGRRRSLQTVFAAEVLPQVEDVGCFFKSTTSEHRILHAASDDDKFVLITDEFQTDQGLIGYLTFDANNMLQEARAIRIKLASNRNATHVYAFGKGEDIMLGVTDPTWHANSLVLTQVRMAGLKQPRVILEDDKDSLGRWWLVKVGESQKLFILKGKIFMSGGTERSLTRKKGLLHCYNLDNREKPELEGVAEVEDESTGCFWLECAAAANDVYIWETTYEKPELLGRRILRCARWSSSGKLEWLSYKTGPQVHFAVDCSDGSAALIIESHEKMPSEEGLPRSDISLVKAGSPEIMKIGTFPGQYILRLQLLRTESSVYPWAGLFAPSANNEMLLLRATDEHKGVTRVVHRDFETTDAALVSKGSELRLFRVSRNKVTLSKVEDFWTK